MIRPPFNGNTVLMYVIQYIHNYDIIKLLLENGAEIETKHKGGTNIFKLNRIQKIEESKETYVIDERFSAEDYFKYSLGVIHIHGAEPIEFKLKFNKDLIPLISENKIHPSMEIISKTEEEMEVTFTVYNTIELKNKILSYGANAEVISPKKLRDEIKEIIINTIKNYQ